MKERVAGFDFQEVPLEEAQIMVRAGCGNYAEIKSMLLEKLPRLEGKAFAFGLPNGKELEQKMWHSICVSINLCLRKSGVEWKVYYSTLKKLFICVPGKPITYKKSASPKMSEMHRAREKLAEVTPEVLISLAEQCLNTNRKDSSLFGKKLRRAVAVVAQEDFHFNQRSMDRALGYKKGSVNYILRHPSDLGKKETAILRAAIKERINS